MSEKHRVSPWLSDLTSCWLLRVWNLLSARLLPEAEEERRGRAGCEREGERDGGRRAVTQAEGPQQADTFSTGDPTLRDQPTPPCSPAPPQWHCIDSSAWRWSLTQRLLGFFQCTGSVPRHDPWPLTPDPPESALSHSPSVPALSRRQGLPPSCIRCPRVVPPQISELSFSGLVLKLREKKRRANFDWFVPRISGRVFAPLRRTSANPSPVYLFNSYGKFWKTLKTSRVTRHPKATANVKLLFCILNSMFKRFLSATCSVDLRYNL